MRVIEDGHLVLAADEGQGVVKAGGAEAFVGEQRWAIDSLSFR